jgi:hypothetical protein
MDGCGDRELPQVLFGTWKRPTKPALQGSTLHARGNLKFLNDEKFFYQIPSA